MKTFFNLKTLLCFAICGLSLVACEFIEPQVATTAQSDETQVQDRFCYMPLNCNCEEIQSETEACSWGGTTETKSSPRCNDMSEYLNFINSYQSFGDRLHRNVYAVFFGSQAICKPEFLRETNEVICHKECYTKKMWVDDFVQYGVVDICSAQPFKPESFKVLGIPPSSYTVTYESEDNIHCFSVNLLPNGGVYLPHEWSNDMIIFKVDYQ